LRYDAEIVTPSEYRCVSGEMTKAHEPDRELRADHVPRRRRIWIRSKGRRRVRRKEKSAGPRESVSVVVARFEWDAEARMSCAVVQRASGLDHYAGNRAEKVEMAIERGARDPSRSWIEPWCATF
jgi:hypothetical protein